MGVTEMSRRPNTPNIPSPPTTTGSNRIAEKWKDPSQGGKASGAHEATPADIPQASDTLPPADVPSDLTITNPFALKATTQNSFGPRHQTEEDFATADNGDLLESVVLASTESSEEDISKHLPQKRLVRI
jgi:hypothetical protein